MIDIHFYMNAYDLKKRIMNGERLPKDLLYEKLNKFRRQKPVVYNIETTNACNMKCEMCPRTTMMTRRIEKLDNKLFNKIINEIEPWSDAEWELWQQFVEKNYGIDRNDMSENHFFLHIIPKVIQLHGYGDPLLDKDMSNRIDKLTKRGFSSYFSCNPANIDIKKNLQMFKSGLTYIKYSIESVDDFLHKKIRGEASNFSESYNKILVLLDEKKKNNYQTTIVITMLDLKRTDQLEEFTKLRKAFEGRDVYIYMKSQDQQWYMDKKEGTNSIHWTEFCQFPWSSMTIKSNGEAAMCVEDFNNEIILGDARSQSLSEIWNGDRYTQFRKEHFSCKKKMKCTEQCDMKMIGKMVALEGCTDDKR